MTVPRHTRRALAVHRHRHQLDTVVYGLLLVAPLAGTLIKSAQPMHVHTHTNALAHKELFAAHFITSDGRALTLHNIDTNRLPLYDFVPCGLSCRMCGKRAHIIHNTHAHTHETSLNGSFSSIMILPQVHLRKPCYDFCPVQATAIKAVSTKESPPRKASKQRSPLFSKRLSPGQRRAVCTKGRDVINVS